MIRPNREFCYLELLRPLVAERIHFVIRPHRGSHPPTFCDADGRRILPTVSPGETVMYNRVRYKGQVGVNLIGIGKNGLSEPLWRRPFRDLKSRLGMTRPMNQRQEMMEQMLVLLFLVYPIALLVGERLRGFLYGELVA